MLEDVSVSLPRAHSVCIHPYRPHPIHTTTHCCTRYVLEDVSDRSLVLIDELGKGTEVFAGSALSGAIIERLAATRCRGLFATHLHLLHEMGLRAPGLGLARMEVVERSAEEVGRLAGGRVWGV